jgi:hypothetical protein
MSKLETNTIDTISGSTNLTLGGTNATDITIPSGVTITNNGTQSGFGGVNTPSFLAYASSNQTVGHESWTKVTLGTELFDTDSAFASNKFTVPTGEGGKYCFNGCVNAYAGTNNLKRILMRLYKNGSGFAYFSSNNWDNQAYRDQETATGSTIISLSAGDYIELYIWFSHASSGNTTIVGSSASEFITKLSGFKIIE